MSQTEPYEVMAIRFVATCRRKPRGGGIFPFSELKISFSNLS